MKDLLIIGSIVVIFMSVFMLGIAIIGILHYFTHTRPRRLRRLAEEKEARLDQEWWDRLGEGDSLVHVGNGFKYKVCLHDGGEMKYLADTCYFWIRPRHRVCYTNPEERVPW